MNTPKIKILITGANGQLGYELQRALKGYDIILTDIIARNHQDTRNNNQTIGLDITDIEKVHQVFEREKPDFVIHTAAYTNVDGAQDDPKTAFEVNRDGSRNIAEASKKVGAKLIAISTDYVFDGEKKQPYTEDDVPNPQGIYAESKLAGEVQTMLKYPDAIILRTAWMYGGLPVLNSKVKIQKSHAYRQAGKLQFKIQKYPDQENNIYKNFPNTILYNAMQGKELKVVNDQFGSPTYAGDLARAIKQIIEKGGIEPGIYHAVNNGLTNWYSFAIATIMSSRAKREIPSNINKGEISHIVRNDIQNIIKPCKTADFPTKAKRPKYSVLSTEKLKSVGIEMPSWEKGLKNFIVR